MGVRYRTGYSLLYFDNRETVISKGYIGVAYVIHTVYCYLEHRPKEFDGNASSLQHCMFIYSKALISEVLVVAIQMTTNS